ncbi:MAG: RsbRD N-terminal domain-containing protein [Spirochaetia bacterium]|nr:RsbRD N-terminal domain-containing protein [Spirochaetia bacterium]
MSLVDYLKEKKPKIFEEWKKVSLLPFQEGSTFYKNTGQFSNPVAWTTEKELNNIYDALTGLLDEKSVDRAIDGIVRIRAVQEASPSDSIQFLSNFKTVLKNQFKDFESLKLKSGETISMDEFSDMISGIDRLIYRAFDLYMSCREQLFKIKLDQISQGIPDSGPHCPSALLDELPKVEFNQQIKPFQGDNS